MDMSVLETATDSKVWDFDLVVNRTDRYSTERHLTAHSNADAVRETIVAEAREYDADWTEVMRFDGSGTFRDDAEGIFLDTTSQRSTGDELETQESISLLLKAFLHQDSDNLLALLHVWEWVPKLVGLDNDPLNMDLQVIAHVTNSDTHAEVGGLHINSTLSTDTGIATNNSIAFWGEENWNRVRSDVEVVTDLATSDSLPWEELISRLVGSDESLAADITALIETSHTEMCPDGVHRVIVNMSSTGANGVGGQFKLKLSETNGYSDNVYWNPYVHELLSPDGYHKEEERCLWRLDQISNNACYDGEGEFRARYWSDPATYTAANAAANVAWSVRLENGTVIAQGGSDGASCGNNCYGDQPWNINHACNNDPSCQNGAYGTIASCSDLMNAIANATTGLSCESQLGYDTINNLCCQSCAASGALPDNSPRVYGRDLRYFEGGEGMHGSGAVVEQLNLDAHIKLENLTQEHPIISVDSELWANDKRVWLKAGLLANGSEAGMVMGADVLSWGDCGTGYAPVTVEFFSANNSNHSRDSNFYTPYGLHVSIRDPIGNDEIEFRWYNGIQYQSDIYEPTGVSRCVHAGYDDPSHLSSIVMEPSCNFRSTNSGEMYAEDCSYGYCNVNEVRGICQDAHDSSDCSNSGGGSFTYTETFYKAQPRIYWVEPSFEVTRCVPVGTHSVLPPCVDPDPYDTQPDYLSDIRFRVVGTTVEGSVLENPTACDYVGEVHVVDGIKDDDESDSTIVGTADTSLFLSGEMRWGQEDILADMDMGGEYGEHAGTLDRSGIGYLPDRQQPSGNLSMSMRMTNETGQGQEMGMTVAAVEMTGSAVDMEGDEEVVITAGANVTWSTDTGLGLNMTGFLDWDGDQVDLLDWGVDLDLNTDNRMVALSVGAGEGDYTSLMTFDTDVGYMWEDHLIDSGMSFLLTLDGNELYGFDAWVALSCDNACYENGLSSSSCSVWELQPDGCDLDNSTDSSTATTDSSTATTDSSTATTDSSTATTDSSTATTDSSTESCDVPVMKAQPLCVACAQRARADCEASCSTKKGGVFSAGDVYEDMLKIALGDGKVTGAEKVLLAQYKVKYDITDSDHVYSLARQGWTSSQFKAGGKRSV